ncbi:MAG: hypothetical protein MJ215_05790 [Spirochaetia bacterium]|nr:hypothetical protein [Spirochaetia bacterium]
MKKSLAILMTLVLVIGLLAGCASSKATALINENPAENEYAALGLYNTCLDLQAKVAEDKKATETYTKGVSIFSAGKACVEKGLYTEALAPLGQTQKFWSSIQDKDAPAFANDEYNAKGLLYTCLDLMNKVPEDKKTTEPYTKGVSIFSLGKNCVEKGMYSEAIAPLGQVKKFWSGLIK